MTALVRIPTQERRQEVTVLPAADEARFQAWVRANRITDVDHPDSHYDYRGFWREHGDAPVKFGVDHFPDTYKQHGHPTFSTESQYSGGAADGGHWKGEEFVAQDKDPFADLPELVAKRRSEDDPFADLPETLHRRVGEEAGDLRRRAAGRKTRSDITQVGAPENPGAEKLTGWRETASDVFEGLAGMVADPITAASMSVRMPLKALGTVALSSAEEELKARRADAGVRDNEEPVNVELPGVGYMGVERHPVLAHAAPRLDVNHLESRNPADASAGHHAPTESMATSLPKKDEVSRKEATIAAAQLAALAVAPGAGRVVGEVAAPLIGPRAAAMAAAGTSGAMGGAAYSPEKPLTGAVAGGVAGAGIAALSGARVPARGRRLVIDESHRVSADPGFTDYTVEDLGKQATRPEMDARRLLTAGKQPTAETAAGAPGPTAPAPVVETAPGRAPSPPVAFKTSKAVYDFSPEGTSTRQSANAEMARPSEKTVFVRPETAVNLRQLIWKDALEGLTGVVTQLPDGRIAYTVSAGPGQPPIPERSRFVKTTDQPIIGLHPIELWGGTNTKGPWGPVVVQPTWDIGEAITDVQLAQPPESVLSPEDIAILQGRGPTDARAPGQPGTGSAAPTVAQGGGAGVPRTAASAEGTLEPRRPAANAKPVVPFTPLIERPVVEGPVGDEDQVHFSNGRAVQTRYRLVEADHVLPSHDPFSFEPSEQYPIGVQGREYSGTRGKQARDHVITETSKLRPEPLLDLGSGTTDGPPVITPHGIAVVGNQRAMMIRRAEKHDIPKYREYRTQLRERAPRFGIDPTVMDTMRAPMLVREIIDPSVDITDPATLAELNQLSDQTSTKAKDVLSAAAGRAGALKNAGKALDYFTATIAADDGSERSIRQYLGTADGSQFVRELFGDAVLAPQERGGFIDGAGKVTEQGKDVITAMLQMAAIGDADVVHRAPPSIMAKLEHAIPAIVRANATGIYSLETEIRGALDLLGRVAAARAERQAKGFTVGGYGVEAFVTQQDIFSNEIGPEIVDFATFLERAKKSEVTSTLRQYAKIASEAAAHLQSHDMFNQEPEKPGRLKDRLFRGDEGENVLRDRGKRVRVGESKQPSKRGEVTVRVEPHETYDNSFRISAQRDGVDVGDMTVGPNRHNEAEFSAMNVWVDPAVRRQGIARAMYQAAFDAGIRPIVSDYAKQSPDAGKFWDGVGHGTFSGRDAGTLRDSDLFGNDTASADDQSSLFSGKDGTESARNLEQTVRAAKSELEKLSDLPIGALTQKQLSRIAQLERLVNRDQAISPRELQHRIGADREVSIPADGGDEQGLLLDRPPRERFYSRLERAIQNAPFEKGTAAQWNAHLSKNVAKGEREWTKIDDPLWDAFQGGTIPKDYLLERFKANKIDLKESVAAGDAPARRAAEQAVFEAEREAYRAIDEAGGRHDDLLHAFVRETRHNRVPPVRVVRAIEGRSMNVVAKTPENLQRVSIAFHDLNEALDDLDRLRTDLPKFEQYSEPGGENYREIKIQLDRQGRAKPKPPEPLTELPEGYDLIVDPKQPEDRQWGVTPPGQIHARPLNDRRYGSRSIAIRETLADLNTERTVRAMNEWKASGPAAFTTDHFPEKDILVHARVKDRTLPNGEKVLFIEELQSDWHQKGRRRGYKGNATSPRVETIGKELAAIYASAEFRAGTPALDRKVAELHVERDNLLNGEVPDAPFKKSEEWMGLAMKRLIDEAVEGGYDRIAWTTGVQQADRYDLSKHVDDLEYHPNDGDLVARKDGRVVHEGRYDVRALPDVIGKDAADKLMAQSPSDTDAMAQLRRRGKAVEAFEKLEPPSQYHALPRSSWYLRYESGEEMGVWLSREDAEKDMERLNKSIGDGPSVRRLTGVDLKVGGEGMKAFYDQMLPKWVKAYGKKLGVKVELEPLGGARAMPDGQVPFDESEEIGSSKRLSGNQSFKITPELKDAIAGGQMLMDKPVELSEDQVKRFEKAERSPSGPDARELTHEEAINAYGSVRERLRIGTALDTYLARIRKAGLPIAGTRAEEVRKGGAREFTPLIGADVSDPIALRAALTVMRHPSAEHLGFIVRKDGKVLAHQIYTSDALDFINVTNKQLNDLVDWVEQLADEHGDDIDVVMHHNHPSGNPTLSDPDRRWNQKVWRALKGRDIQLAGHMVIDHNTAMWSHDFRIEGAAFKSQEASVITEGTDDAAPWRTSHARPRANTPAGLASQIVAAVDTDAITAVGLDKHGKIVAVLPRPVQDFTSVHEWVPDLRKGTASHEVILLVPESLRQPMIDVVSSARDSGDLWAHYIQNVVGVRETGGTDRTPKLTSAVQRGQLDGIDEERRDRLEGGRTVARRVDGPERGSDDRDPGRDGNPDQPTPAATPGDARPVRDEGDDGLLKDEPDYKPPAMDPKARAAFTAARKGIDFSGRAAREAGFHRGSFIDKLNRFADGIANGLGPIERLGELVDDKLKPSQNPFDLLSRAKASDYTVRTFLGVGVVDPKTRQVIGPSFKSLFEPFGQDTERIMDALTFVKAVRDVGRGLEGMAGDKVGYQNAKLIVEHGRRDRDLVRFEKGWKAYVDGIGNYAVKTGLWTQAFWDKLKKSDALYVRYRRIALETVEEAAGAPPTGHTGGDGKRFVNVTPGVEKFEGGRAPITNPAEAMAEYTGSIIRRADRYAVGAAFFDAADAMGSEGAFVITRIPASEAKQRGIVSARMRANAKRLGLDNETLEQLVDSFDLRFDPENPIIWRNTTGDQREYAQVNSPELWKAVAALNATDEGPLRLILNYTIRPLRRLFTATTTGLNVAFSVGTNPVRDVVDATAKSRAGMTPIDIAKGYAEAVKDLASKSELVTDADLAGLGNVSMFQNEVNPRAVSRRVAPVSGLDRARNIASKVNPVMHTVHALEGIGSASDKGPRMAEYIAALRQLQPKLDSGEWTVEEVRLRAVRMARPVSMDFANKPGWPLLRFFADYVPFFGPALQAPVLLTRAAARNPARVGGVAAAIALLALIAWALKRKRGEGITEITDDRLPSERAAYLLFPTDDEGSVIRIPLPQEFGLIAAATTAALDKLSGDDVHNADLLQAAVARALPPGIGELVQGNITVPIPGVQQLLENRANRKDYDGRPVVPTRMAGLLPKDRRLESTAPTFDILAAGARKIGFKETSPLEVENLVRGVTSGATPLITAVTDRIAARVAGRDIPPAQPISASALHPARVFYRGGPPQNAASEEKYYTIRRRHEEVQNSLRKADKSNDGVSVRQTIRDYEAYLNPEVKKIIDITDAQVESARSDEQEVVAARNAGAMKMREASELIGKIRSSRHDAERLAMQALRSLGVKP